MSGDDLNRRLRFLHLEDNEADFVLVGAALEKGGVECAIQTARSRAEFVAALGAATFDLILSDYSLPSFDGAAALAAAKAIQPETPFMYVSGTIGEERAVESLRRGAVDYVLKDHLDRLVPAVQRALGEVAEQRRRREAEEALRASEERFREMAESSRDVFLVTSPDSRQLIYVSPAYEKIWGHPRPGPGTDFSRWIETVVPEDRRAVFQARARLVDGAETQVQYRISRADGTIRWIEDRGYPVRSPAGALVRALHTASDITERKELETQLLQSQKMEAVGQLAGGVAHDFNNVLTVINGYSRLMLDEGGFPPGAEERLRQIYAAGIRAGNLIRQLLLFSRKQAANKQVVAFNPFVEEIAKLIRRLIGEDIRLELNLAPDLPPVNADVGMLEQVLMNLAVNARDAMPRGGPLTITTEVVRLDAAGAAHNPSRRPGRFLCLGIRDGGGGIPPEVLPKIFEPFFTTKPAGVGTGLGLATVFGIIQQHEGWIEVESQVGTGTCFRIYLPPAAAPVDERGKTVQPFAGRGTETILLVEDEAPVREFVVAVLEHFGYRVLQAGSGVQALEVWKWHAARIALLLTDLVMPDGMTGAELARTLQAQKPALKVVYTSGYTSAMSNQVFGLGAQAAFLQKPYLPAKLASVVRESLDGPPPPPAG